MFTPDPSQSVTDHLLVDASDGIDTVTRELIGLYDHWLLTGADAPAIDWLALVIARLGWWSGRLAGGVSDPSDEFSCR